MNFDMLNPLSSYLSRNGYTEKPVDLAPPEMSDWGIEDSVLTPTLSNYSNHKASLYSDGYFEGPFEQPQPYFLQKKPPSRRASSVSHDFQHYYQKYIPHPIAANTENFSKYIHKYLSLGHTSHEFWERFKYSLIVLNLLDDAMILLKNEQAMTMLESKISPPVGETLLMPHVSMPVLIDYLNHDGTKLTILGKRYALTYSAKYRNRKYILLVINMIIRLLKEKIKSTLSSSSQAKIFKIILIIATKLIKFQRANLIIHTNQTTELLNTFLLCNYKANKKIVTSLISLKEMSLFNFMGNPYQSTSAEALQYRQDLKAIVLQVLHSLILNLKASIVQLLPYLNGELLEQYCSINNVNMDILSISYDKFKQRNEEEDIINDKPNELDEVVFNINKFNQLRKFFVCQLLTINESPVKRNFFLVKVMDQFCLPHSTKHHFLGNDTKLKLLKDVLEAHNETLKSSYSLIDKFYSVSHFKPESNGNTTEWDSKLSGLHANQVSSNLTTLVSKVSNLSTNLKFFEKYNEATKSLNNIDELNEKKMIFKQFSDDLANIESLYHVNLADLEDELSQVQHRNDQELNQPSPSASHSNSIVDSPRSSIDNSTGLKMFHNAAIKKRYSLPSNAESRAALQSPITNTFPEKFNSPESATSSGKKYKRLSTGLQLGLLTVFEDDTASGKKNSKGAKKQGNVAFDDNYININPPQSYETYNQLTLDQLSSANLKKISLGNFMHANRFSLNSVNSNLSGLTDMINSTQRTSFDDNPTENDSDGEITNRRVAQLGNEELKQKLEESFNRIYNLESENHQLKNKRISENATVKTGNSTHTVVDPQKMSSESMNDHSFLSELEKKLNKSNEDHIPLVQDEEAST